VLKTIRKFTSNKVLIKWPNDILSGNKKISGILIENLVRSNKIYSTIIGAGININQIIFRNLPNATSIKHSSKKDVSVDVVLQELVKNYKLYLPKVYNVNELSKEYHLNLYGLESCTFLLNGKILKGKVVKVLENGKIQVKINSLGIGEYNTGEIKIII
jgi:BirA family biotin operon repressor/biotin-[acetyl-CoA-carboxylase] ligase